MLKGRLSLLQVAGLLTGAANSWNMMHSPSRRANKGRIPPKPTNQRSGRPQKGGGEGRQEEEEEEEGEECRRTEAE